VINGRVDSQNLQPLQYCCPRRHVPLTSSIRSNDRLLLQQRRKQLVDAGRIRYKTLSYQEKGSLLDELVQLSGYPRKSVLRLLRQQPASHGGFPRRCQQHDRRRSRIVTGVRRRTTVRTFNGRKGVEPGWFEMDLVAHCGGRMEGPFLWTLVLTDVASGWSECVPLPGRDGLLERWCAETRKPVELTRSRAYKSNDQAWVEQKNGIIIRRVVGHRRLKGAQQLERLCQLYAALRLFTNIYQPSAKRIPFEESDARDGRRPRRRHDQPLTPADRLLGWRGLGRKGRQLIEALQQH
jgi:hypothetical protein